MAEAPWTGKRDEAAWPGLGAVDDCRGCRLTCVSVIGAATRMAPRLIKPSEAELAVRGGGGGGAVTEGRAAWAGRDMI
jgi:hypothetical protein